MRLTFDQAIEAARERAAHIDLDGLRRAGVYLRPLEYYLVGTYPPLKAMGPADPSQVLAGASANCNIYVHLPFCEQQCTFCHFAKEIRPQASRVTRYLDALHRDIAMTTERVGGPRRAHSAYFGGGTPSYLEPQELAALFDQLWQHVELDDAAEVTFELHPGLVRHADYGERIDAVRERGANRFVFGVQSMDEQVLATINRGHGRGEVFAMLDILGERGIDNVNVDLIYGLPHQTLENWYATIAVLLDAGLRKFNVFPLMFKHSDPVTHLFSKSPELFPSEEDRLLMHLMAEAILHAEGFQRGPVLYYAKTATHSRQQESKFDDIEDTNLLPFGVSGFGYVGGTQFYNECRLTPYIDAVERGEQPIWRAATLSDDERMRRAMMFGLRSKGIDRAAFAARFGVDPLERFSEQLGRLGDLGVLNVGERTIAPSDDGSVFVDGMALQFVSDEVKQTVGRRNESIANPKQDPIDRHDYSPLGRTNVPGGIGTRRARRELELKGA